MTPYFSGAVGSGDLRQSSGCRLGRKRQPDAAPVLALGHPAHRNRVAVQRARYFALHLVNVEVTLAWGTDTHFARLVHTCLSHVVFSCYLVRASRCDGSGRRPWNPSRIAGSRVFRFIPSPLWRVRAPRFAPAIASSSRLLCAQHFLHRAKRRKSRESVRHHRVDALIEKAERALRS